MKIAYVCADPGIPLGGHKGASVHFRCLAMALARRGNELTLVCRNTQGDYTLPRGLRVEQLPGAEDLHENWLSLLFAEIRPDVILERYSLSSGPALAAAQSHRIPLVLEVNAPLVDEAAEYRGLKDVDRWRSRERQVVRAADRIIAVSTAIRSHVLKMAVEPRRVALIHNGVDLASFAGTDGRAVRTRYGLEEATVIGFSGSLKPWHGVEALIGILASMPVQVSLLIVGDGPQRADLEGLAKSERLSDRVVFTGAVPHGRVPELLAAMDVAAAPYVPQANFYFSPLKVVEYLAAGLPVVATDQGDMRLLVGDAGILVPAGDSAALTRAISRLTADPELRRRLAVAARAQVRDSDWTSVAGRVETVLASARAAA